MGHELLRGGSRVGRPGWLGHASPAHDRTEASADRDLASRYLRSRLRLAPQTNRIFYDEHIYMQIGQTWRTRVARNMPATPKLNMGILRSWASSWATKQPKRASLTCYSWASPNVWRLRRRGVCDDQGRRGSAVAVLYFALVLGHPWTLPTGAPFAVALSTLPLHWSFGGAGRWP